MVKTSIKRLCEIEERTPGIDYIMHVDGHDITIIGHGNVDYFHSHYQSLGYQIIRNYIIGV